LKSSMGTVKALILSLILKIVMMTPTSITAKLLICSHEYGLFTNFTTSVHMKSVLAQRRIPTLQITLSVY